MARQWFHKTLGIKENAGEDEIIRAHRKLAKQFHPDRNDSPFAKERMQELNEAKDQALSRLGKSSKSRTSHSTSKRGSKKKQTKRSTRTQNGAGSRSRSRRNRSSSRDGKNLNRSISITLLEAYFGAIKQIDFRGSSVAVSIPPGADTDHVIRIAAAGEKGSNGGKSGDLLVRVVVRDDPTFERDGDNLRTEISIDSELALRGGKVEVETLTGAVNLTIPPKSRTTDRLRLSGKGMPAGSGGFGDLIVALSVLPDTSNRGQDYAQADEDRGHTVDNASIENLPCVLTAVVLAIVCIAAPAIAIRNHNAAVAANATATVIAEAYSTSTAERKATTTAKAEARFTAREEARTTTTAKAEASSTAREEARTTTTAKAKASSTAREEARTTALAEATNIVRSRATRTAPLRATVSDPWQKTATAAVQPIYYVIAKDPYVSRIRTCPRKTCATVGRLHFGNQIRSHQLVYGDSVNESNVWIKFEYDGEVAYVHSLSAVRAEAELK